MLCMLETGTPLSQRIRSGEGCRPCSAINVCQDEENFLAILQKALA